MKSYTADVGTDCVSDLDCVSLFHASVDYETSTVNYKEKKKKDGFTKRIH